LLALAGGGADLPAGEPVTIRTRHPRNRTTLSDRPRRRARARSFLTTLLISAAAGQGACAQARSDRPPAGGAGPPQASRADLVDALALDSTFVLDVRYATPRNFTGRTLYPVARCLLRADTAERLVRVHERLRREGLRLRLFDCYRPLSIQRELWALVPDERYVADPAKGSRHNRAAAVDLTLADSTGAALPMPSEYDEFTERAHRDYQGGTAAELANRRRLEQAMAAEGFVGLPTEWWHFDAPGWESYPVLDVPLAAR
jgi:D-alanyl-D-alanine dipeptidase